MTNDYSLTDIATATGGGRNNDGIFGGNGAWWIIILFLFARKYIVRGVARGGLKG